MSLFVRSLIFLLPLRTYKFLLFKQPEIEESTYKKYKIKCLNCAIKKFDKLKFLNTSCFAKTITIKIFALIFRINSLIELNVNTRNEKMSAHAEITFITKSKSLLLTLN